MLILFDINEWSNSSSELLQFRSEFHSSAEVHCIYKCQKMKLNIEAKKERKPIGVTATTKKMYVAISKPKMTIRYHVFKNIKNRSENST